MEGKSPRTDDPDGQMISGAAVSRGPSEKYSYIMLYQFYFQIYLMMYPLWLGNFQ